MACQRSAPRPSGSQTAQPFRHAEEAWFWFVQCRSAQTEGARVSAGMARVPRPCEPVDILAVVDRLYRRRRLLRPHLEVLADYGRQCLRPDGRRPGQARAARLWDEALGEMTPALRRKGILE